MNVESSTSSLELGEIESFVVEQIRSVVPGQLDEMITLDASLYEFGLDSLASMAVVNRIEESLGIHLAEQSLYHIETCRDLVEIVQESIAEKASDATA